MSKKPTLPHPVCAILRIPAVIAVLLFILAWTPKAAAQTDQIVISIAPVSVTNTVGDNVEFFVGAYDSNIPTNALAYQWANSSGPIAGATNHTLVLTNIQLSSADTYTVTITDDFATNSTSAKLTVVSTFNPANNLAAWLPLDDGQSNPSAQTAADASGNGNAGMLENFENDGFEWVPGVAGGALFYANLNGASNNIVVVNDAPNLNFTNNLAFTLSAWVAGSAYSTFEGSLYSSPFTGQFAGAPIICKGHGNGGEQYELDAYTSGNFRFYVRNASGTVSTAQSSIPVNNSGVWQHVVATYDGNVGRMAVYVNGALVASNTTAPSSLLYSSEPVTIGNRASSATSGYNSPFVGVIDDARIYSYALSASDVTALYQSYSTNVQPSIFAAPTATQPIYAGGSLQLYGFEDGLSAPNYSWTFTGTNTISATNAATLTISNLAAGNNGTATLTVSNTAGTTTKAFNVTGITPAYSYAAAVMALGPLAYYPLNETNSKTFNPSTSVAYDYSHGDNAIVGSVANLGVAGPTQPQYYGFPQNNQALGLVQQAGGFAQPTTFGMSGNKVATFTAWIYTTANNQANSSGLIYNRQSGNGGGMDYNGHLGYTWNNNNSSTYNWNSGLIPTNGVWTFVAIAIGLNSTVGYMGGTNAILYSATNNVASTETASWTTQGLTFIGEDSNSSTVGTVNTGRIFNGSIAQAAIYNYQLSMSQIQSLYYAAGFVPQFPRMLASTNVNQGQNATLTVTNIAGSLPMNYTWYSIAPGGASNFLAAGSLTNYTGNTVSWTITNAQPSLNGNVYYLAVSNQYGVTTSNTLVNVFAAPTFTTGPTPTNPIIYAGQNISFSVTASGAQPIIYQWSTNGTPIAGVNASSVTLTAVPQGTYTVTCTASNSVSTVSGSTTLTVQPVPSSPFPQSVLALQPLGYWRLNEAELGGGNNGLICHDYIQGNDGIYTNVVLGNSGYNAVDSTIAGFAYDTESSAAFGATTNSSFGPNSCAYGIPNIDFSKPAGTSVNFTVQAWAYGYGNAVNTPAVVGKGIYGNEEFTIDSATVSGQQVYRFSIRNAALTVYNANSTVTDNDQKWHFLVGVCDQAHGKVSLYIDGTNAASVAITNNAGLAGTSASFPMSIGARSSAGTSYDQQFNGFVNDVAVFNYALTSNQVQNEYYSAGIAPTVSLPTNNITVNEFGTLTETASAVGTPPLAYQWYYTDNNNNAVILNGQTNAILQLTNVQATYANVYVVVTNAFGSATSSPTTLFVNSGAAYINQDITPLTIDAPAGATASYSVVAYGAEPIYYEWVLNGTTVIPGATNSTYTFTVLAGTNTYQCGVSNSQNGSFALGQTATVMASSTPPQIGFDNGAGWQLQGFAVSPSLANGVLTLTDGNKSEGSSAYYTTMQYIGSGFVASFTYTPSGSGTRADGIAFVLQNSSAGPAALGGVGGGLGVVGTSPSVEFEMDIYSGSAGGAGINWETNGMTAGNGGRPNGGTGSVNINSGNPINVALVYNSSSNVLQVTLQDTVTHASYTTNYSTGSLPALLGSDIAYVGFTGASGGSTAVQQISNFNFAYLTPQEPPVIVEDLTPLALTNYASTPVTYSVQVAGTAPFSYAWFENGTKIPGATNATYALALPVGTNTLQCGVSNLQSGGVYTYSSIATLVGAPLPTDAFAANVLGYGPMAFWRLNEPTGSTTAFDYIGGFNGVYGNLTTNGQPGIPNPPFLGVPEDDFGVWMDSASASTNGFVATTSMNTTLTNATLICWIYPKGSQNNSEGLVFSRGSTANGINYAANNSMGYTWNNAPATYNWSSGLAIPTNAWSFLALVITPSNAVAYVFNANSIASNTNAVANPPVALTAGFALGADPQASTLSTRIFNGEMDDVAVFDYALTPAQLTQLYSVGARGLLVKIQSVGSNLVLSWPFGTLYQSPTVNGPWTQVPNATSPYTNTPSAGNMFYRVIAVP